MKKNVDIVYIPSSETGYTNVVHSLSEGDDEYTLCSGYYGEVVTSTVYSKHIMPNKRGEYKNGLQRS